MQSATERDLESFRARAEREAAPEVVEDDATGKYEDPEERAIARARRPTDERIARIEAKHDKLEEVVTAIRDSSVATNAKLTILVDLAAKADEARLSASKYRWSQIPGIIKAIGLAVAAVVTALVVRG